MARTRSRFPFYRMRDGLPISLLVSPVPAHVTEDVQAINAAEQNIYACIYIHMHA